MQKITFITGAAGGLGSALTDLLKADGRVVGSLDLNPNPAADASACVDVSDPEALGEEYAKLADELGTPDAMVCLAGRVQDGVVAGIKPGGLSMYPIDQWRTTLDVNLTGTFNAIQCFAKSMIMGRRKGAIVTVSSPAAVGAPGQAAYAASKAGVEALTRSAAIELAPYGIRVCGFRPPITKTPMADLYPGEIMDNLKSRSNLGRFATTEEVSEAIKFLIDSPLASGKTYPLDGGLDL
ncbi:MAG: SDR family oxidoreductase [Alphaproteobacteria bacterium]|nr:SDR family oxidoreductase [Alphaproteobacteria bacterium SS10]